MRRWRRTHGVVPLRLVVRVQGVVRVRVGVIMLGGRMCMRPYGVAIYASVPGAACTGCH